MAHVEPLEESTTAVTLQPPEVLAAGQTNNAKQSDMKQIGDAEKRSTSVSEGRDSKAMRSPNRIDGVLDAKPAACLADGEMNQPAQNCISEKEGKDQSSSLGWLLEICEAECSGIGNDEVQHQESHLNHGSPLRLGGCQVEGGEVDRNRYSLSSNALGPALRRLPWPTLHDYHLDMHIRDLSERPWYRGNQESPALMDMAGNDFTIQDECWSLGSMDGIHFLPVLDQSRELPEMSLDGVNEAVRTEDTVFMGLWRPHRLY